MNTITLLTDATLDAWLDANTLARGPEHLRRLMQFWQEMLEGRRLIWAAWRKTGEDDAFLGHITLQPVSEYPLFRKNATPEIVDLFVMPQSRRLGVGRELLHAAIGEAQRRNAPAIGLGVGITHDYGAAHRLYARSGFIPDGKGLFVQGRRVEKGEQAFIDHRAMLMWEKDLS